MPKIDLRSDTVTQPTPEMRAAMAEAEVGDDVLGEDPTVKTLENLSAQMLGKEAALFLPSGTMANLAAVLTHGSRGDEVLLGDRSHIFLNEVGGIAALGGVHPHLLPNEPDGTLALELLEQSIRSSDLHFPTTRLICLENTHNFCHGSPISPDYMEKVHALAAQHGLAVHLDGARIFNAAAALKLDVKELCRQADSVMFSLSKGLSAPVGSILGGTLDFINRARKTRKMLGGGMRQAGHLAAAGIVALEQQVTRLGEDHATAYKLAQGIDALDGLDIDLSMVKTNILFFQISHPTLPPESFIEKVDAGGVRMLITGPAIFRAVTHRHITMEDIEAVLETFGEILA